MFHNAKKSKLLTLGTDRLLRPGGRGGSFGGGEVQFLKRVNFGGQF